MATTSTAKMERGGVTEACSTHLASATTMSIRQTRRGWCQELLGCEAKTEFKYFNDSKTQIAHSLEDTDCFCRMCCTAIHPFVMRVNELNTESELLTVDRPLVCCAVSSCKCCCYQKATFSSGGNELGTLQEDCYYCVPQFTINDSSTGSAVYKVHPPTCCGGMCVNCCTEGGNCMSVCCKVPFWIYDANNTSDDAAAIGKILKLPKSLMTEVFTDANAFDVTFPEQATAKQKAMLVGTSIFLNAVFFEEDNNGN